MPRHPEGMVKWIIQVQDILTGQGASPSSYDDGSYADDSSAPQQQASRGGGGGGRAPPPGDYYGGQGAPV